MSSITSLDEQRESFISVTSYDGKSLEINRDYLLLSELVKVMLEAEPNLNNIMLYEEDIGIKDGVILEKIVEFLKLAKGAEPKEIEKPIKSKNMAENTSEEFATYIDKIIEVHGYPFLFEIIKASNYLQINFLTQLCCAKIAAEIKGKSIEDVKKCVDNMVKKSC